MQAPVHARGGSAESHDDVQVEDAGEHLLLVRAEVVLDGAVVEELLELGEVFGRRLDVLLLVVLASVGARRTLLSLVLASAGASWTVLAFVRHDA